jgi:hypothetical protein
VRPRPGITGRRGDDVLDLAFDVPMQAARIILYCVLGAVGYGVVHDQITARICLKYFTIGHPQVFNTQSATLLGIGWGVIATWWVGEPLAETSVGRWR